MFVMNLWWPGLEFQIFLLPYAILNMACVFIGAQRISKVVYFCGGILFLPFFIWYLYTNISYALLQTLSCFLATALGIGILIAAPSVKNTHIYRLIVSVTIGGLPFFAAAFFRDLFSDGMTDYNASALQFSLCALFGFNGLCVIHLMQHRIPYRQRMKRLSLLLIIFGMLFSAAWSSARIFGTQYAVASRSGDIWMILLMGIINMSGGLLLYYSTQEKEKLV